MLLSLSLLVLVAIPAAALAAPPEVPQTIKPELETITAEGATLRGVLNPGAPGEAGATYQFLYRASATECEGGSASPEPEEASAGADAEEVRQPIEGLTPQTRYSACLKAKSTGGEVSVGPVVHFLTGPPETPTGEEVLDITATSATLKGILNPTSPGEPGKYRFRYAPSETECEGAGEKQLPDELEPAAESLGTQSEVVEATARGLLPTTTYTFCLWTRTQAFETAIGAPITFTTPAAAPSISAETASAVNATGATVGAIVSSGGLPTKYHVEFVTASQFASAEWAEAARAPLSDNELPAVLTGVSVQQKLEGLSPATAYHYRVVAFNSLGFTFGASATFITPALSASLLGLPDGRAYELASGDASLGEVYIPGLGLSVEYSPSEQPFRASADGDSVAYVGDPGAEGGNGLTGANTGNEFLSQRDAPLGGWRAAAITPQTADPEESENGVTQYEGFSGDLSVGVFGSQPGARFAAGTVPGAPHPCQVLYSRQRAGTLAPLFTQTQNPGFCGRFPQPTNSQNLKFAGGNEGTATTPEYQYLLFQSPAALTPEATQSTFAEQGGSNLYVSMAAENHLVSVLPDGTPDSDTVFGATAIDTSSRFGLSNVISADGAQIFFTDLNTHRIYVRENPAHAQSPLGPNQECTVASAACTVPVSAGSASYWTATPDGRFVFYTENEELWRYDTAQGSRKALVAEGVGGEPAGVKGVIGASRDGSFVYVVAEAALSSAEGEARICAEAPPGSAEAEEESSGHLPPGRGCNLYLLSPGAPPTLVATLAAKDNNLEREGRSESVPLGDWQADLGSRTAQVTPNGHDLVFESTQQLTGYDNSLLDGSSPQNGLEVFTYQVGAPVDRKLLCASCDPGNAPPVIPENDHGSLGTTYLSVSGNSTYMRRWMSDDGTRVFFTTSEPLVSADVNDGPDVYEWEREGTSGCPSATSTYGGCVFLLSGGDSRFRSEFVDASSTGDDVFFVHRGRLGEIGSSFGQSNLFDARVGGGFPRGSAGCSGANCGPNAALALQILAPSSASLQGPGNATPAKKKAKRHRKHKHHRGHHRRNRASRGFGPQKTKGRS